MKATGIIRRIDDLGRIVIPKEIRRNCKIREGDPLEIFMDEDEGGVVLRKYDTTVSKVEFAEKWLKEQAAIIKSHSPTFFIRGDTTICEVIRNNSWQRGEAHCSSGDDFNASIGMVISLCRAWGTEVPEEFYE